LDFGALVSLPCFVLVKRQENTYELHLVCEVANEQLAEEKSSTDYFLYSPDDSLEPDCTIDSKISEYVSLYTKAAEKLNPTEVTEINSSVLNFYQTIKNGGNGNNKMLGIVKLNTGVIAKVNKLLEKGHIADNDKNFLTELK
jgi:hypothetical protein